MIKLIVFSIFLVFVTAVPQKVPVVKNPHQKIINGEEAVPHSIPYQVWIKMYADMGNQMCGGVLISSKYVLTAGHCVYQAIDAYITLGAHDITQNEDTQVRIGAKRLILHPDYNNDIIKNDIGLIELMSKINETDSIKPAIFSTDVNNTFEGATAKVSGWGVTNGTEYELSPVLIFEENTIISNDECNKYFSGSFLQASESNICLGGYDGKGACHGDSGGPLTVDGKLVGLVSWGNGNCEPGSPTVFTRVTSFLEWIQENSDIAVV